MCRTKTLSTPRAVLTIATAALAAMTLGSRLLAAPERLPQFDPVKTCRSGGTLWGTPRQAAESCVRSEQEARATLEQSWNEILAADRGNCSLLVTTGGQPSYVELLSCVEMAREARAYREQRAKNAAEPPRAADAPRSAPKSKARQSERNVGTHQLEPAS